ncbi:hypothetical protein L9F63_004393 [Diploptera punctata]|uniref:Uncharacterized protein n=1 Tax=Diploptera punctata TaxID=6984 RepID=A0AAD7ZFY2_DIPPU|nr:hypothetical protein L9F63_004393 [Diploptera punctata]
MEIPVPQPSTQCTTVPSVNSSDSRVPYAASPDMLQTIINNSTLCNNLGLVSMNEEVENVQVINQNGANNQNMNVVDPSKQASQPLIQQNGISAHLEQIVNNSVVDSGKQITDILKLLSSTGQIQGIQLSETMVNDANASSTNVFEAHGTRAAEILNFLSNSGQIQDIQIGSFGENQPEIKSPGNILYLTSPMSTENFANIVNSSVVEIDQNKSNSQNNVEIVNSRVVLQVQNPTSAQNFTNISDVDTSLMETESISQKNAEVASPRIVLQVQNPTSSSVSDDNFTNNISDISSSVMEINESDSQNDIEVGSSSLVLQVQNPTSSSISNENFPDNISGISSSIMETSQDESNPQNNFEIPNSRIILHVLNHNPSIINENFTNDISEMGPSIIQIYENPENNIKIPNSRLVLQVPNSSPASITSNSTNIASSSLADINQNEINSCDNIEMVNSKIVLHVQDAPVILDPDKGNHINSSAINSSKTMALWSGNVQSSHEQDISSCIVPVSISEQSDQNLVNQFTFTVTDKQGSILKDIAADADICKCDPCMCNPSLQECQDCNSKETENIQVVPNHNLNRKRKNISITDENGPVTQSGENLSLVSNFENKKLVLPNNVTTFISRNRDLEVANIPHLSQITSPDETNVLVQNTNNITLTEPSVSSDLYQGVPVISQDISENNTRLAYNHTNNDIQKSNMISGSCNCCGKNSDKSCSSEMQSKKDPCCVVVCLKTLETLKRFVEKSCCSGADNSLRALALQISERSSSCCSEKHK